MANVLILNGTLSYPFAKGTLNQSFVDTAQAWLRSQGPDVRVTQIQEGYDPEEEIASHLWADRIILQFPINWMGLPWIFKKYMDEVYTAGMDGRLSLGDGRGESMQVADYGMGGALGGKKYMISTTLNAPKEAFDTPSHPFFQGASLDDLLKPVHLTLAFCGLQQLPTFAAFDVVKNPQIDQDFTRFETHLTSAFEDIA